MAGTVVDHYCRLHRIEPEWELIQSDDIWKCQLTIPGVLNSWKASSEDKDDAKKQTVEQFKNWVRSTGGVGGVLGFKQEQQQPQEPGEPEQPQEALEQEQPQEALVQEQPYEVPQAKRVRHQAGWDCAAAALSPILKLPPDVVTQAVQQGIALAQVLSHPEVLNDPGALQSMLAESNPRKRRAFEESPTEVSALVPAPARPLPVGALQPGLVAPGTQSAISMNAKASAPSKKQSQSLDSVFQALLDAMRRGLPSEALDVAQKRLAGQPGCMSVAHLAKIIQGAAVRSGIEETEHLLSGLDDMMLVEYPDEPSRSYFKRFARWTVREILAQGQSVLSMTSRIPAKNLMNMGMCVTPLIAELGKAGNELKLQGQVPLPHGHGFSKGDWLFVTFPADGAVVGVNDLTAQSITLEGELVTLFAERACALCVKLAGITKDKLDNYLGMTCRVDRAANRVTFHRQIDALKTFCGHGGAREVSWIRQVIFAADEFKVLASTRLEAILCTSFPQGGGFDLVANSQLWTFMNNSQQFAIKECLNRKLTLVQGPPGSGKTHSAVLLIRLWLASHRGPVLATADSNVAVDNLLDGCIKAGLEAVRVGRPEATRPDLERYNLLERAAATASILAGMGGKPSHGDQSLWREEKGLLSRAQVVCCTCSGADHPVVQGMDFPSIIFDEAGQCTEPSMLVPMLRMHPLRGSCVLIGDHRQLPPTVVDQLSEQEGLGLTLFERLADRGVEPVMLDIQYRMHPAIAQFPSYRYYEARLRSGVRGQKRLPPAGINWPEPQTPICFLPVEGREVSEGTSWSNHAEIGAIETLLESVLGAGDIKPEDIGVITPYAAQVRNLRRTLSRSPALARLNCRPTKGQVGGVEVSSVDGFQGREKELIIVSTVRANLTGNIGFLSDNRRLNVTITRARRGLLVCGHFDTLGRDRQGWRPWLSWAQERGLVAGYAATDPKKAAALVTLSQLSEEELLAGNI
eukprot:TRINITY_DN4287_c0_g3_i1.p1 TRINITY_DN4287_c0_g3~~TRINITY_DN4287_c0_g3_i1.p1  ORF type:complete len:981 (-),score=143.26 TRINITY_DN4287_c0_g3_i1:47-2965(-)